MGGDPPPGYSSGGMRTKLIAARIATGAGCAMAIALGQPDHPLRGIDGGARCTWFLPSPKAALPQALDRRLASPARQPHCRCRRGAGAGARISLLPAGVRGVEGSFHRGDPVSVRDEAGREVARGLAAYDVEDARRIAGHRSEELEKILGWRGRDKIVDSRRPRAHALSR